MSMKTMIVDVLRKVADLVEDDTITCSEEDMSKAIDNLARLNPKRDLSKEEACQYLNVSRSTFDSYVKTGLVPKGEKRLGFKELSWTEDELRKSSNDLCDLRYKN